MSKSIPELEARVHTLEDQLITAKRELREARLAAAEFKLGDVVEASLHWGNKAWHPAIIRRVRFNWRGEPEYEVAFQNKGGEWSKRISAYVAVRKAQ